MDDIPIGGGKGPQAMDEHPPEEIKQAPTESGPLEERIISKSWNTRATAFEELTTGFVNANS